MKKGHHNWVHEEKVVGLVGEKSKGKNRMRRNGG